MKTSHSFMFLALQRTAICKTINLTYSFERIPFALKTCWMAKRRTVSWHLPYPGGKELSQCQMNAELMFLFLLIEDDMVALPSLDFFSIVTIRINDYPNTGEILYLNTAGLTFIYKSSHTLFFSFSRIQRDLGDHFYCFKRSRQSLKWLWLMSFLPLPWLIIYDIKCPISNYVAHFLQTPGNGRS